MTFPWLEVPVVHPVRFRGSGGAGGSHPILLEADNGRIIHVKLKHNPQSTRSLVSDWVGTLLAKAVLAPVPDVVLVDIPFSRIGDIPELTRVRWHPGRQFGTVFVLGAKKISGNTPLANLSNLHDLPLVALTESWLYNNDIKFSHLLWCAEPVPHFLVTDHGFIFPSGPNWTPRTLSIRQFDFPSISPLTEIARSLAMEWDFSGALKRIRQITPDVLESLMASVPSEWPLNSEQRNAVIQFLVRRQPLLDAAAARLNRIWTVRAN